MEDEAGHVVLPPLALLLRGGADEDDELAGFVSPRFASSVLNESQLRPPSVIAESPASHRALPSPDPPPPPTATATTTATVVDDAALLLVQLAQGPSFLALRQQADDEFATVVRQLSEKPPRQKRQRTNSAQLDVLESVFVRNAMPGPEMRMQLAQELGMTPRRVQVWFQNKRAKVRKAQLSSSSESSSQQQSQRIAVMTPFIAYPVIATN